MEQYPEGIKISDSNDTLDIFGEIAEYWGVDLAYVNGRLHGGSSGPLKVRVNSVGGDLLQGMAIKSLLEDYKGTVTADVLGIAASAASAILMGADRIRMYRGSFIMIHNPWTMAGGDARALKTAVDSLKVMQSELAQVYVDAILKRKGGDPNEVYARVIQWMDAETWFSPDDAVAVGLADEIIGVQSKVSDTAIKAAAHKLNFTQTPVRVKNLIMATKKAPKSGGAISAFVAGMRKLLNQIEVEPVEENESVEAPDQGIVITMSVDEMIAALEELGYSVSAPEPIEAMDDEEKKEAAMDEEEIQNRIDAAVKAAMKAYEQNKKASTPVSAKVQTKAAYNRAEQIRNAKGRQFDAFAKLVNNR